MSVEVFGSVKPTVENNGLIMNVQSITSLESSSSSSELSSDSSSSIMSSESSSTEMSSAGVSSAAPASSAVSAPASSKAAVSSSNKSVQASSAATSTVSWEASDELTAKANAMAKDKMDVSFWTQQYCVSNNINFCVPIHKNWYYKSFGATTSFIWHVEVGPTEMNNLGEGPISINLVAGDISSTGMTDGQVSVQNGTAIGMRAWTNNRHFELRAPASLEAAVKYITAGLKATAG